MRNVIKLCQNSVLKGMRMADLNDKMMSFFLKKKDIILSSIWH